MSNGNKAHIEANLEVIREYLRIQFKGSLEAQEADSLTGEDREDPPGPS